jgi:hypothetical protein
MGGLVPRRTHLGFLCHNVDSHLPNIVTGLVPIANKKVVNAVAVLDLKIV